MYKSKLQELCQKRSWNLPDYETHKEGPPHNPRFSSTVTVNSIPFVSPSPSTTAKLAQNSAAMLAFNHFSQPNPNPNSIYTPSITDLSSFPQPARSSHGSPVHSPCVDNILPTYRVLQPKLEAEFQTSQISTIPTTCSPGHSPGVDNLVPTNSVLQQKLEAAFQTSLTSGPVTTVTDITKAQDQKCMLHTYKNQLQYYTQKRNLNLPSYSSEWEGPPHALRFKCKVTVDGQVFESPKFYSSLKDAEHAAAEFALMSLLPNGVQEENNAMYKNLLQELVQKEGFSLPVYSTVKSGEAHIPIFVSQVEVEGELFTGQEAKSKKQAETSAAKVAYTTLKERTGNCSEAKVITCLEHHSHKKSPVSPGLVPGNQSNNDKVEKGSSSFGNTNGGSADSSVTNDKTISPFSDSNNVASKTSGMSSTAISTSSRKKKIVVYSRKANVPIEAGGTLLPISDDKWVAYSYYQ